MTIPFHLRKPTIQFREGRKIITNASSEFPEQETPVTPAKVPALNGLGVTRKLNRRRIVGDRASLYGTNVVKKDPTGFGKENINGSHPGYD